MTTRLATLTCRLSAAFAILFTLAACGGGGGGGSFIPDESTPIAITTTSLPPVETSPYTTILEATGGSEPYTWTIEDDAGTGFTIDNRGVLTGSSPSQPGTYAITISVTGKKGATARATYALEVSAESGINIISTALPAAIDGLDYIALVEASGGVLPYTWAIADDGGTGLTIDDEGFLTGVAPVAGSYGITLLVTDASSKTAQQSFIFSVTGENTSQPLTIATTSLPAAAEGEPYTAILQANGGQGDYMWTLIDDGGTGLDLRDDGILSGTGPAEGAYAITVSVMDNTRTATSALSLAVNPDPSPLTITTTSLPGATEDVRYAAVLEATGGTESYTWSLVSGGASGLTLTPAGVLSGTPTTAGTFGITFEVDDGENIVEGSATVTVSAAADAPALVISTQTLPAPTGVNYVATLAASGGVQPYVWSMPNDGGSGLTLTTGGVLSGTTPASDTYSLLVSVTDSDGTNTQKVLTLTVP
jgi:hypothetical protein